MPIYVHLAWDGGIFVIRGESGEQLWVDSAGDYYELDEGIPSHAREAE